MKRGRFQSRVQNSTTPLQISFIECKMKSLYIKKAGVEFGVGVEAGVLAPLMKTFLILHGGLSFYRKVNNFFFQVGMSLSATTNISVNDLRYVGHVVPSCGGVMSFER